jgi:hypothetical protein
MPKVAPNSSQIEIWVEVDRPLLRNHECARTFGYSRTKCGLFHVGDLTAYEILFLSSILG